jgi:hypothetical protein
MVMDGLGKNRYEGLSMSKKRKSPAAAGLSKQELHFKTAYQTVVVVGIAAKEGSGELSDGQYLHVKDLLKQLVGFGRREFESQLRIEKFGEFWELKEKGGVLGKKDIRVYFKEHVEKNEIVILSTYKKEDDGQVPGYIRIRLKSRWRMYLKGDFENNVIRYRKPGT